jgi:hypothetical protein
MREDLLWDARIEGALEKREDGWQWVRVTRANHKDRKRLRAAAERPAQPERNSR